MKRSRWLIATLTTVAALLCATSANAAFPGQNGKIAFNANGDSVNSDIYVVNPDGSGLTNLTNGAGGWEPAFSADGRYIAFVADRNNIDSTELYWMRADGSVQSSALREEFGLHGPTWSPDGRMLAFITTYAGIEWFSFDGSASMSLAPQGRQPAWSPDGSKFAYSYDDLGRETGHHIHVVNVDGTGDREITSGPGWEENPDWSPDGQKIVFHKTNAPVGTDNAIYTVDPAGGPVTEVPGTTADTNPSWSPDGSKLAVGSYDPTTRTYSLVTMNADGGGRTTVVSGLTYDPDPDWGGIASAPRGYPRPKGATPFQVYFVLSYQGCVTGNEQHGAPLAVDSCSPPQQQSDFLTVGTLDSNGQPAKFVGSMRFDVVQGNSATPQDEADVKINSSFKDVRCKSIGEECDGNPLSDYLGALQAVVPLRITDRNNGPPHPEYDDIATSRDVERFLFEIPCSTTADTTVGSTCSVSTTFDSVIPGVVKEGVRSNWQLGQVQIFDGGPNAASRDEATRFAVQGIFVP